MSCCLFSCFDVSSPVHSVGNVEGYRPLYGSRSALTISVGDPRTLRNPGKIYLYNNYLLINEQNEGIHVFDNSNPSEPKPLYFINMLGNTDMAIKDDILYADHNGDIKAIRLNGFGSILVLDSISISNWQLGVPPPVGFYFDCVDPSQGVVVGWQEVTLNNPDCYAIGGLWVAE